MSLAPLRRGLFSVPRPDVVLSDDRPAHGGRRRAPRRTEIPRAARRHQPGRLPRDRRRARADSDNPMLRATPGDSRPGSTSSRADRVVAIGETDDAARLADEGCAARTASPSSPTGSTASAITPQPRGKRLGSRARPRSTGSSVMHSGNIGHAQDLDTLIRATTFRSATSMNLSDRAGRGPELVTPS